MRMSCHINGATDIMNYLDEERWSNAACCGYLIWACENLGYREAAIRQLIGAMEDVFDMKTVAQAKQKYYDH